jgi:[protein-PII] uridylyltransferase
MEAAANAAALADRVDRLDLLLIGALFHDIGKGSPGDHTANGIDQIATIATRMGFDRRDVQILQTLVRLHLLLPDTATRRDLDDPQTIEAVARAAGDPEIVSLLAALTEADSLATGPSAWGTWKAGLVAELADRAIRQLEGKEAPALRGWVSDLHRQMMSEVRGSGKPVVIVDQPRVLVAAPDRPGLLSSVAGTLALHGLDVRSADATGEEGVALEVFTVEMARGSWPDGVRLRVDLEAVLSGHLSLSDELAQKSKAYEVGRRPESARPVVPEVTVDNTASASSTIIEVRTLDELGLLHRVTRALFDCSLDVVSARVSTIGSEVVDAFYVRNGSGEKVTGDAALRDVNTKVRAAVQ